MHHHNSKRAKLIKLIAIYVAMTLATVSIVAFILLIVLGFRFDTNKQQLEQYAFLQFNSNPTGAMVAVDGKEVSGRTPNKTSVPEGSHEVVVWKDGYETWRKTLNLKSGTLTWLDYIIMVPKQLNVEAVSKYDALYGSLASPSGKYMLIQQYADKPTFDIVDLINDGTKATQIVVPKKDYSEAYTSSIKHTFKVDQWDQGERYLLVQHNYGDKIEWLVVDSKNTDNTKNITKLFDLQFSNIKFSGNGGNILFALESGNIRKLDVNAETISKLLVTKVKQFSVFDQNIITYVGDGDSGSRVVGLYRDGNSVPYVIKTIAAGNNSPLTAKSARYFNEDYVAIAEGQKVEVMNGSYRSSIIDNTPDLKLINSFETVANVQDLSFSPSGQYILAQSGANFSSYDIERQSLVTSTVDNTGSASSLKWLNNSYFWSDNKGNMNIREFDGSNPRSINDVVVGQDAIMVRNGEYIYSLGKNETGYQLQRVRMVSL